MVRSADQNALGVIDDNGLAAAQGLVSWFDVVAFGREAGNDGGGNRAFCENCLPLWEEARKIQSRLRVHAIDIAVHHHIHMAHGLEITTHDAEAHVDLAVFLGHGRNNGVKRTLGGANAIGMANLR